MTDQQFEMWKAQQIEMNYWMARIVEYLDRIETQLIEIKNSQNTVAIPEGE